MHIAVARRPEAVRDDHQFIKIWKVDSDIMLNNMKADQVIRAITKYKRQTPIFSHSEKINTTIAFRKLKIIFDSIL